MTDVCPVSAEVTTVNYHIIKPCNMKCGLCFARFLDILSNHLTVSDALLLVTHIARAGFRKFNFAGGEPTLISWLPSLIQHAKDLGLTTSVVTNGSRITESWLDELTGFLDILAISIDSVDPERQRRIGRLVNGKPPMTVADYLGIAESAKARGTA